MVTATGGVCQQLVTPAPVPLSRSKRTHPHTDFSSQGLPRRCARNTERSAVKNQRVRREERGSGVCSFLPRSHSGAVVFPAPRTVSAINIVLSAAAGNTARFRPDARAVVKHAGRGVGMKIRRPLFCSHLPIAGCLNAIQGMPVRIRLTAPIFKTSVKVSRQVATMSFHLNTETQGARRNTGEEKYEAE